MGITTVREFMQALRSGKYTWPGCYPTFFVTSDGEVLSHDSARSEVWQIARAIRDNDRGRVVGVDVNWEDPSLYCDHSNERIESAYAEPEDAPLTTVSEV